MTTTPTLRDGVRDGATAILPLLLGVVPFALIVGVVSASAVIGPLTAWSTNLIIFAGASQLAIIQLFDAGTSAAVVIATALVINLRHVMYSAALAEPFTEFPRWTRFALPYLMTDQAFALSTVRFAEESDPTYRRGYYMGTGFGLWIPWQIATTTGTIFGAAVPEAWSLDFAVPLVFLVLLILAAKTRPGVLAAVAAGMVAVLGINIPYRLGLIVAAIVGVAVGMAAERMVPGQGNES